MAFDTLRSLFFRVDDFAVPLIMLILGIGLSNWMYERVRSRIPHDHEEEE